MRRGGDNRFIGNGNKIPSLPDQDGLSIGKPERPGRTQSRNSNRHEPNYDGEHVSTDDLVSGGHARWVENQVVRVNCDFAGALPVSTFGSLDFLDRVSFQRVLYCQKHPWRRKLKLTECMARLEMADFAGEPGTAPEDSLSSTASEASMRFMACLGRRMAKGNLRTIDDSICGGEGKGKLGSGSVW
jgi:hypothetical protein